MTVWTERRWTGLNDQKFFECVIISRDMSIPIGWWTLILKPTKWHQLHFFMLSSQKRGIDNLLRLMTGASVNSAPIDIGCVVVNHSSSPANNSSNKERHRRQCIIIFFFKVGSIEVQVLSWKSIPSICAVLQDPDYKSGTGGRSSSELLSCFNLRKSCRTTWKWPGVSR